MFIVQTVIDGQMLSHSEMAYQLSKVIEIAKNRSGECVTPVGVLTSAHRDKAARAMQLLLQGLLAFILLYLHPYQPRRPSVYNATVMFLVAYAWQHSFVP